jgi:DNA topoisomerase-2
MAQDFVGSNNINLLVPSGQFGTRLVGGEDAASPRYIFTHLSPVSRFLFPEDDDLLLDYLEDDGQMIEPKYFCPIIPLLLVNGSQGIGTGWSTFIPQHNPLSVVDYIRAKLDKSLETSQIEPYSRGFLGTIERHDRGYISYGRIKVLHKNTVLIDELPIGVWTNKYKKHLLKMQSRGTIIEFQENHTTTKVSFKVKVRPSQLLQMEQSGLEKAFGLTSNLPLTNMNAFDATGKIQKFHSAESIADAYFPCRLGLYHDRKSVLMSQMEYNAEMQENKARFIKMVSESKIDLMGGKTSKEETCNALQELGFKTLEDLQQIRNNNTLHVNNLTEDINDQHGHEDGLQNNSSSFDYLLKMPLSSLTSEKIAALTKDASVTKAELQKIKDTDPEELWMADLENLARHL